MKILHSSDLHGSFKKLLNFNDFDVWVDTGDFFPNKTRGNVGVEKEFQTAFFKYNWPHPKKVRLEEAEEELHHAKKELNRFEKEYSRWVATSSSPSKTREARKKWETGIAHRNENVWDLERNLQHARDDWRDAQKKPGFKPTYSIGKMLTKWLDGRPLISVPGNHDYVSLANLMKQSGARTYSVTPKGVVVDGVRYSGFREIPWIHGEWAGETHQDGFRGPVGEVFRSPPDILVTHAGPANIMTGSDDWHGGINTLATALSYKPHKIKAHFFGHDHDFGSQTREEMGVLFSNSATKPKIVTIPGLAVNNPSKKRKPRVPKRRSVVHEVHILKTPKAGAHTPKKGKKGYQRREKHPKRIEYNPAPRLTKERSPGGKAPSTYWLDWATHEYRVRLENWNLKYDVFPDYTQWVAKVWADAPYGAEEAQALLAAAAAHRSNKYWNASYEQQRSTAREEREAHRRLQAVLLDLEGDELTGKWQAAQPKSLFKEGRLQLRLNKGRLVPKDHSLRRNGSVALKNSSASEVYDPRDEQKRAHVQGIYEGMVRQMLGLPYTTPFRDSKGMRLDAKHGVEGPSTWGIQGRHRINYGSRNYLKKSRDRYRDVDHLIRNRQTYEETLGLQRQEGFYRYTKEPTKDGFRYFVWPMPPGVELPMWMVDEAAAEEYSRELSNRHDPRRTGKWWKPPRQAYTRGELDHWLPPASAFKL